MGWRWHNRKYSSVALNETGSESNALARGPSGVSQYQSELVEGIAVRV